MKRRPFFSPDPITSARIWFIFPPSRNGSLNVFPANQARAELGKINSGRDAVVVAARAAEVEAEAAAARARVRLGELEAELERTAAQVARRTLEVSCVFSCW